MRKQSSLLNVGLVMALAVASLMGVVWAQSGGYVRYNISVIDETGAAVTDSVTLSVFSPGTTTAVTVYSDTAKTSIGSTLTARKDGFFRFYSDLPTLDIKATNNTTGKVVRGRSLGASATIVLGRGETIMPYGAIKTVRKTIGCPAYGTTTVDANWTTAANTTKQTLDLGAIVPKHAKILNACMLSTEDANCTTTGKPTLTVHIGTTSDGNQLCMDATAVGDANQVKFRALNDANVEAVNDPNTAAASHVYVSGTPSANWSTMVAGKWTVLVTYLDLADLK